MDNKPNRAVILSDIHVPYSNFALISKITKWMSKQYLHTVIINGDFLDCASISKFSTPESPSLELEIEMGLQLLEEIVTAARKKNPKCKIVWHDGNHEYRLQLYMQKEAKQLAGLKDEFGVRTISIPSLMRLRKQSISYKTYKNGVTKLCHDLYVEHGDRVSKHAGYTAKTVQTDKGASVIVGHVHRCGCYTKKDRTGFHRAYECPCLCTLDPDYISAGSANWSNGFMVIDWDKKQWWAQQVLALDNDFMVDGRVH